MFKTGPYSDATPAARALRSSKYTSAVWAIGHYRSIDKGASWPFCDPRYGMGNFFADVQAASLPLAPTAIASTFHHTLHGPLNGLLTGTSSWRTTSRCWMSWVWHWDARPGQLQCIARGSPADTIVHAVAIPASGTKLGLYPLSRNSARPNQHSPTSRRTLKESRKTLQKLSAWAIKGATHLPKRHRNGPQRQTFPRKLRHLFTLC